MVVKSGGLGLQQLEARLLVLGQRLRPGHGGENTKSYPLDQQQGPGSLALQKKIPTDMGSSETSEVFIRRKRVQYVWIDTKADLESYGAFLLSFL